MTTTSEIVRCLKYDMEGDLLAGARYAERIAANAGLNPWQDDAGFYHNYAEAARLLRKEHQQSLIDQMP